MGYIFLDFNGTVLDDLNLCINLLNEMLVMKGHQSITKEKYLEIFGFPVIEYYKRAGFDFNNYTFSELADYFIAEYSRRNIKECKIFSDVKKALDLAHNNGFKVILCSASKLNLLIEQLVSFDILDLFDDVIGLDDHHAKSKVDLAVNYIKNNNIDINNLYFVGDTDHDALVAKSCNAKALLVARGHQNKHILNTHCSLVFDSLYSAFEHIIND